MVSIISVKITETLLTHVFLLPCPVYHTTLESAFGSPAVFPDWRMFCQPWTDSPLCQQVVETLPASGKKKKIAKSTPTFKNYFWDKHQFPQSFGEILHSQKVLKHIDCLHFPSCANNSSENRGFQLFVQGKVAATEHQWWKDSYNFPQSQTQA